MLLVVLLLALVVMRPFAHAYKSDTRQAVARKPIRTGAGNVPFLMSAKIELRHLLLNAITSGSFTSLSGMAFIEKSSLG